MRRKISDCVGCEVCAAGCTRKHPYTVIECDECGGEVDFDEAYVGDDGKEYCYECIIAKHNDEFLNWAIDNYGKKWVEDNFDAAEECDE